MTKDRDGVMVMRMKQSRNDENDGDDDYFQSYISSFTTPIIHHSCIPICQLMIIITKMTWLNDGLVAIIIILQRY